MKERNTSKQKALNRTCILTSVFILICLNLTTGCLLSTPRSHWTTSHSFVHDSIQTIAVIAEDKSRKIRGSGTVRIVEDEFTKHLIQKGYRVAARRDAQAVEEELVILTDQELVEIGRILQADAVLLVSINDVQQSRERKSAKVIDIRGRSRQENYTEYTVAVSMSARLINLNREIIGTGSYRGRSRDRRGYPTEAAIENTARSLARSFTPRVQEE